MPDIRLRAARKFLAHIRSGPKPSALPRLAIDREDVELRRQLGQVLDVLDGVSGVLGHALTDAITYRDPAPVAVCPQCTAVKAAWSGRGLCDDHAEDQARTSAYLAAAAELGIEVNR
jgi:hypothetical protein